MISIRKGGTRVTTSCCISSAAPVRRRRPKQQRGGSESRCRPLVWQLRSRRQLHAILSKQISIGDQPFHRSLVLRRVLGLSPGVPLFQGQTSIAAADSFSLRFWKRNGGTVLGAQLPFSKTFTAYRCPREGRDGYCDFRDDDTSGGIAVPIQAWNELPVLGLAFSGGEDTVVTFTQLVDPETVWFIRNRWISLALLGDRHERAIGDRRRFRRWRQRAVTHPENQRMIGRAVIGVR